MSGTFTQISQCVETATCQSNIRLHSALPQLAKEQEVEHGQTGQTAGVDWFSQQLNMTLKADNGIVWRRIMQKLFVLLFLFLGIWLHLSSFWHLLYMLLYVGDKTS